VCQPGRRRYCEIYFEGKEAGKYECRIFNLQGSLSGKILKKDSAKECLNGFRRIVQSGDMLYISRVRGECEGKVVVMR